MFCEGSRILGPVGREAPEAGVSLSLSPLSKKTKKVAEFIGLIISFVMRCTVQEDGIDAHRHKITE